MNKRVLAPGSLTASDSTHSWQSRSPLPFDHSKISMLVPQSLQRFPILTGSQSGDIPQSSTWLGGFSSIPEAGFLLNKADFSIASSNQIRLQLHAWQSLHLRVEAIVRSYVHGVSCERGEVNKGYAMQRTENLNIQ